MRAGHAVGSVTILAGFLLLASLAASPVRAANGVSASAEVSGCSATLKDGAPDPSISLALIPETTETGCPGSGAADSSAFYSSGGLFANASVSGAFTANATANLTVTEHLQGPAGATQVTDTVDMIIHGTTSAPFLGIPTSDWSACIAAGAAGQIFTTPGCVTVVQGDGNEVSRTLGLAISVPAVNGKVDVSLSFSLYVDALGTVNPLDTTMPIAGSANFDHTVYITQTLPPNWTFTEDSGTFLTTSPVPEPSSLLLLACGVGALAWPARRFRAGRRPGRRAAAPAA